VIEKKVMLILYAYAMRNPYIHYCQGFNFIAAHIVMRGYTEEEVT